MGPARRNFISPLVAMKSGKIDLKIKRKRREEGDEEERRRQKRYEDGGEKEKHKIKKEGEICDRWI